MKRTAIAAIALVAAAGAVESSWANGAPAGTVTITPRSTSAAHDTVLPLAGSPKWLVFQQSSQVLGASNEVTIVPFNEVNLPDDPATRVIRARSATGTTVTLTKKRATDAPWSIATNVVTAERTSFPEPLRTRVDWWNLARHTHGTVRLKKGQSYLSAAPGGFMLNTPTGVQRMNVSTGKVRNYAVPRQAGGLEVISGPKGMVVGFSGAHFYYIRFAHPRPFVRLKTHANDTNTPGQCTAVGVHYATCFIFYDGDDSRAPRRDLLVPLNGGKPTVATRCAGIPALSGHTMIWAQVTGSSVPQCEELRSRGARADNVTTSMTRALGPGATAYGKAIFISGDGGTLLAATSATHAIPIFTAPRSPVTVGSFALSTGRITDADDQPVAGHVQEVEVATRTISSDGHAVSVGERSDLTADQPLPVNARMVAASGANTAYLATNSTTLTPDLWVASPFGTTRIHNVAPFDITLSGNRVMYEALAGSEPDVRLTDLVTHSTRRLGPPINWQNGHEHALWGNYLIYTTNTQMIRQNLTSGSKKVVTSFGPNSAKDLVGAYGNQVVVRLNRDATIYNLANRTKTKIHVGNSAYDVPTVSSAGIVTVANKHTKFVLRDWAGQTHTLLPTAAVLALGVPEVEGMAMAWLGVSERLNVAPVNLTIQRPWSLGDPAAPGRLVADGSHSWSADIPYSTTIGSCSVTIRSGVSTIRTLPCNPTGQAYGDAAVTWDGRNGSAALVAPGTYTWTVTAGNSAGSALSPAGKTTPMTGTITVTN